jgi:large subunit ribosomal protein L23
MIIENIIKRPILTEKSLSLADKGCFTFEVIKNANKGQVKNAVEKLFKVTVKAVKIVVIPGKPKRWGKKIGHTKGYKKAIVVVSKGKIDLFSLK